ncbi:hypothetical protein [Bradyrhizobium tunisiense]|uniref:hypothetical protein n=1 Tax=Bradyrhizobium tunisiense TaxID=3278709 RepID=UPI0035D7D068
MSGPSYIAGDFWRICDRCGFRKRASQTFRTWDGLYVCNEDFETRHPQDFVRGRKDIQNVPHARPEPLDNVIGPLLTNISVAASAGATTISVESSVRFLAADHIGVMVDGGTEAHIIQSIPTATSIEITAPLRGSAAIGNVVINYSAVSEPDIG